MKEWTPDELGRIAANRDQHIQLRQAREAPRATTETRVAWVAYERGISDRQLEQFYYVNRKGAKQRHFNTEAFAKKYDVDIQWLWHGELTGHPRGLRKQPRKTTRRPVPQEGGAA